MVDIAGGRTLHGLLDARAEVSPERAFATVERADGSLETATFAQLSERSKRTAGALRARGVGRGDCVVVHLPNSMELLLVWFACSRLGAILVPSNMAHTAREIGHTIAHSGARIAVCRLEHAALLRDASATVEIVDDPATLETSEPLEIDVPVDSEDVVQLVFTSGTTSAPKAAMITHANCVRTGLQKAQGLAIGPDDVCVSPLPAFHVNAQCNAVLPALTVGARFVLIEQYSASRFAEQLVRHGATVTNVVAVILRTLLRQPAGPHDRAHAVRRAFYAINVTDAERDEFESRFGITLHNGYGLTEAYMSVTMAPLHGPHRWPSVGLPMMDREVAVRDAEGRDLPPGETGEICVRGVAGRSLMKGYWNDPDATAKALRDGWLHTGDSGRFDPDGYLYFVDRKTDMIKRSGENISTAEVENVLLEHRHVDEAAVIGVPDPVRDQAVKAFVVLAAGGHSVTVEELLAHCASRLAPFKVPSFIEIRSELPKSSIGKVAKKLLRAEADA